MCFTENPSSGSTTENVRKLSTTKKSNNILNTDKIIHILILKFSNIGISHFCDKTHILDKQELILFNKENIFFSNVELVSEYRQIWNKSTYKTGKLWYEHIKQFINEGSAEKEHRLTEISLMPTPRFYFGTKRFLIKTG